LLHGAVQKQNVQKMSGAEDKKPRRKKHYVSNFNEAIA